jgi:hypothetical protein
MKRREEAIMKLIKLATLCLLAAAASLGCSSGGTDGGGASNGDSPATDAGSAGDVVQGPVVPADDPEIDYTQTKTITMDTFMVPAGGEVYDCQNFANPWSAQVDIKAYALDMSQGSHHMFAFYQNGATDGAVAPCANGGLTFGPFTFTAQSPKLNQTYPATVGATLPQTTGFQMMAHYLNTGATPIMAHVSLTAYVAKPGMVTQHAGVLYLNNPTLIVPPGVSKATSSYTLPQDVNLLTTGSHMHKQATDFVSTVNGQTLFTTPDWSEPPGLAYSPPMALTKGTKITWSCTYDNETSNLETFGESANTNVMCISVSTFYPVTDVTNPVIGTALDSIGSL